MADLIFLFEDSWPALSILIAFLSILISIVVYMASKFFGSGQLEQQAKGEIVFAASTLVIVIFVIVALNLADRLAVEYVNIVFFDGQLPNAGTYSIIDFVLAYISNANNCAISILNTLYIIDIFVQAVFSIVMEIAMSELATGFFLNLFSERITNITNILTFYIVIFYVINEILLFLKYFGMFFFSAGVLLRAFPPTRGAGAFIMALCIGLYFLFPVSYLIMATAFSEYYNAVGFPTLNDLALTLSGSSECTASAFTSFDLELPDSTAGALDIGKAVFENSLNLGSHKGMISKFLDSATAFIDMLMMNLCLLPFLALTVALSFVLSASSLFGATIPEVGRGLVKLI